MQKDLGLSKASVNKILSLITDNKKFNIQQNASKEVLMIDLQQEMEKDTIDEAKVKDLATKISQIGSDIFLRNTTDNVKVLNMLTPDQKIKLKEIAQNRGNQMRKSFKKMRKKHKK